MERYSNGLKITVVKGDKDPKIIKGRGRKQKGSNREKDLSEIMNGW